MKAKLKTTFERYGQYITGHIEDPEMYENVKSGRNKWKDTMYSRITHIRLPKEVFERLLELDREQKLLINAPKSNNSEVMSNNEKQIEEMARIICKPTSNKGNCDKCGFKKQCSKFDDATDLYNEGYRKLPDNIGEFSDGYHTFNELYHHRAVLFSVICNMFPERAWKSKLHDTGDMFEGMFIVGIETEQGQATYHYDIEPYWDMFNVKELEKAPKWDGHTPSDAIGRIGNISVEGYRKQSEGEWTYGVEGTMKCSRCRRRMPKIDGARYCPTCGARMRGDKNE